MLMAQPKIMRVRGYAKHLVTVHTVYGVVRQDTRLGLGHGASDVMVTCLDFIM